MALAGLTAEALYRPTHLAAFYAFTFGWSFRVAGRANLPRTGPALLVANHQSFADPALIGAAAPRWLTYLARSNLWHNRLLARVIDAYGAVPIDRGFGKEGLQTVLDQLAQGRVVLMFPEGERTHTGELQPLKPGVSLLVKRVTCPIVPVGVAGSYQAWPRQGKWPRLDPLVLASRGRGIAVAFGAPIDPARYKGMDREAMLADLGAEVRKAFEMAERVRRK
ncbi:MAG TPA: lysophospholipid acyltransferase family protein [Fimbriiglobus sp.]|nr:lysophospholipid acyltransferase family protein [Fimbriiglobus sp.]